MRRHLLVAVVACWLVSPDTSAAPTLTLPNKPDTVKFAAIGDSGTGERAQYDVAALMAEVRGGFTYDFVIMLGDNVYGSQKPNDLVRKFEQPYKPLLDAGVKFYAALGNHDRPENRYYKPWNMNGERYYTFRQKNVRFFVLDSGSIDATQRTWLERELKSSTDDWKIAYFHHPLYSSATRHGSDTGIRAVLEPLFVRYGVNAVFSGHDHVYERVQPQRGIYHFVSGSAGRLRRRNLRKTDLTVVGFDQDQAFMLVEIDKVSLSIQALSRAGKTVDAATLPRQSPASAPKT